MSKQTIMQLPHQQLGHLDLADLKLAIERNFQEIAHIMHVLQIYETRTGRPINNRVVNSGMTDTGVLPVQSLSDTLVGLGHSLQLADNAVTNAKLAVAAVRLENLAANSVNAESIVANAIQNVHIAMNAVGEAQIAVGAVTRDRIANNAVTAQQIAAATITANQLADFAVTREKLADGAVTDTHILIGTITAQRLRLPNHILH